jgi:NTP pyrophosphatase (non-canonical NTP hydrolase)
MEVSISKNDINNFSISEINYIRESIESMSKFNQIEVLKIFNKHNDVTLNENKYGTHINLTELRKEILDELNVYINYVNTQEITLHKVEKQKEDYKNTYFGKDIKDKYII